MSEMMDCEEACSSCSVECSERREAPDFREKLHELSKIRRVIAVMSGKGGVGKSLVTSLAAVGMNRLGYRVGILDADVTGPSIPKMFGISGQLRGTASGAYPLPSDGGIEVASINLMLPQEDAPVIWRGPVISGVVKQFWSEIIWQDIDYLFVDMPPGTGDVPLTIFQSLPVDGILVVTSPQDLVSMIVKKAVNMANMMHIPILGLIENMSFFRCPDCGREHHLFGDSHLPTIAAAYSLPVLGRIPIDPAIAAACDDGLIETLEGHWLDDMLGILKGLA